MANFTRAEWEANCKRKGAPPSDAFLAKAYPDIFGPNAKSVDTKKVAKAKPRVKAKKK